MLDVMISLGLLFGRFDLVTVRRRYLAQKIILQKPSRIQRAEDSNATTPLPPVAQPGGVPEEYEEHIKLLFDLLVLAYQADVTRVSCTQMARELSSRAYPNIGVPAAHHLSLIHI